MPTIEELDRRVAQLEADAAAGVRREAMAERSALHARLAALEGGWRDERRALEAMLKRHLTGPRPLLAAFAFGLLLGGAGGLALAGHLPPAQGIAAASAADGR